MNRTRENASQASRFACVRAALRSFAILCATSIVLIASNSAHAEFLKGEAKLTAAKSYARLVLSFQQSVPTEVTVSGTILVIRFKQPVDVPVDKLSDAVPDYVGSARRDPDGMAIRLALAQKVKVNVMTAGEQVFVDLLSDKWVGLPPSLPPEVVRELSERAVVAERALQLQKIADASKVRPPVRVRASVQPTFVRFTFEMPSGISVSSSLNPSKFLLLFNAPLTFDLADAKLSMPANISAIDQRIDGNNASVSLDLIGEVDVHAFREDTNYVVDVGFEQAQKPIVGNEPKPAAPEVTVSSEAKADLSDIKPPTSEQIAKEIASSPPVATELEPKSAGTEEARPELDAAPEAARSSRPSVPQTSSENKTPAEAAVVPDAVPVVPTVPVETPATPVIKSTTPKVAAQAKRTSDGLRMIFAFDAPTPVAVFRRSDEIWLVFDSESPIDVDGVQSESRSIVNDITTTTWPDGQVVRIRVNRPQLASISGDDRTLIVSLSDTVQTPSQPLAAMRNIADPSHASVSVPFSNASRMHRIVDPISGDMLMVITAPLPSRGFIRRQNFVEFSFLESVHGVVIQPNADDITADIASDKVVVSRPGGLTLSSSVASPERASSVVRPIFDVTEWNENAAAPFTAQLDRLTNAASAASGEILPAHVDLARFYMSRGFYHEAKGVLDLALMTAKAGEDNVAALVVHAVASILCGRLDAALKELASPQIGGNYDAQLWQALAYARQEKWVEAREKFKNREFAITSLPIDLQRILIIDAMRASLEVKDYAGATSRSNDLATIGVTSEQKADVALLRGRLADALGRDKDALSQFQNAAASDDRLASAQAMLLVAAAQQKRGDTESEDFIKNVELVSAMWRGDATEVNALQMMSRYYSEKGRYSEAFAAWRNATLLQPNSAAARQMQDEAAALFIDLYLTPKGDDLPPVEALAMFYEYRDLTPIGRRGDEMIRRLADRLVAVDLLDQASDLLQYQIDRRLEGAARAQVAARLAMIYLTNRKPDRALAALRSTRISDLAGELRQQRLLLESRALSDVGRHDLALDIISNIGGREAVRLRADIYWAARRWRESAEQVELLYGDRWRDFHPLTDIEKSDIIRAAIGYSLAEDAIGLSRMVEKYGAKMQDADDAAAFAIVSKPASANSGDFAKIAKMAAQVDTLEGFLREMKTRFPDAMARAKLPPEVKADPAPTGSLPDIVGLKKVGVAR